MRKSSTSPPPETTHPNHLLELLDWRSQVAELYAAVRSAPNPQAGWVLWRTGRDTLFRMHSQSPVGLANRRLYQGIPCFDYDLALRFTVDLEPVVGLRKVVMLPEGIMQMEPVALTRGLNGTLGCELTIYKIDGYGGGLFLPFRDGTSGQETYGGGRYLIDSMKGANLGTTADKQLILDFNFAYHPSCAHDDTWVCPLAPPDNYLAVAVRAGERL